MLKIPTKKKKAIRRRIKSLFLKRVQIDSLKSWRSSYALAEGGVYGFSLKKNTTARNTIVARAASAIIKLMISFWTWLFSVWVTNMGGITNPSALPTGFATEAIEVAMER